ncbi:MAG: GYF domain-containing protein [Luteolibacter sp.]
MSDTPQDAWFFSKDGKQYGPVGLEELKFIASEGQLHPRQDLVWQAGMEKWTPAGEIEGLFEKVVAPEPAAVLAPPVNLEIPTDEDESSRELMSLQKNWVGVTRIGYLIGLVLVFVAGFLANQYLVPYAMPLIKDAPPWVGLIVPVLVNVGIIVLGVKRLRNVGMSGWWYLGHFVPFLNLWVGYRAFACPGGYQFHRKMDGVGIFLAIIYWLSALFVVFVAIVVLLVMLGVLGDPETQRKLQEIYQQAQSSAAAAPAPAAR